MWAENLFENVVNSDMIGMVDSDMSENLVDSGWNWVDKTEHDIDVKMVA